MAQPLQLTVPSHLPFIGWHREFGFPPADVYAAHADPELVAQWLGASGTRTEISRYDFSTGGSFSYCQRAADGTASTFTGVFHTVHPQELIIPTVDSGDPGAATITFLRFAPLPDGGTLLTGHSVYSTQQLRDQAADSALAALVGSGLDRLEDLLASDSPGAWGLADRVDGWDEPAAWGRL